MGRERVRERERKRVSRDREVNEILIPLSVQGRSSVPSRCMGFRKITDTRENPALLYKILHSFLA